MANRNLNVFLQRLTQGMVAETLLNLSDHQLVEQFLIERNEAAFEAIVRRHGRMVYRVCWRVLQNDQDAEDAFQACFLLFAEKIRTLRKPASLSSWLHGIAHRVALKAKARASTRKSHERKISRPQPDLSGDITWKELSPILDAALAELPEKWRLPLLLCYLEGRTQDEAARQLNWSKRTLRRRLEEARDALAGRLTRRGVVWSAAVSALMLSDSVAPAALNAKLVTSTVQAAAYITAGQGMPAMLVSAKAVSLMKGVVKTMFLTKIKIATVALVVGMMALGGGMLTYRLAAAQGDKPAIASDKPPTSEEREKVPPKPEQAKEKEKEAFTTWGKEVGGLQAGLGYRPGEKRAYSHGEGVTLVLRVRNVGKEVVEFKHIGAFFVENPPTITDADGKLVQLPRLGAEGKHLPHSTNVAPGKEVVLFDWNFDLRPKGETGNKGPRTIHGTGKFILQCERIVGPTSFNPNHPNPAMSKLATGKLELEIKSDVAPATETPKDDDRKKPPDKHDFTNLQRLATTLENFNYPENTATAITVWCQGGGKGTSAQVTDAKTLDVAAACHLIVDGHDEKEGLDLENVAVMSADGTTIRFVNIKEKFAANKLFGLLVNRGELVMVLQLRKE